MQSIYTYTYESRRCASHNIREEVFFIRRGEVIAPEVD